MDNKRSPIIDAAVNQARAAAPNVPSLRDAWGEAMRTELEAIPHSVERTAIAALLSMPTPGVVWLDVAEMVTFARARHLATVGSSIPPTTPDASRTHFLDDLRVRMQTNRRAHIAATDTVHDPARQYFENTGRFRVTRTSGLKLHVSARSLDETIALLDRMLPQLPPNTDIKVATAGLLAQPLSGGTSDQQRKAITAYLPARLDAQALANLLRALTTERTFDPIVGETAIAPGVYMRAEHHIRFRDGVNRELGSHLYRGARQDVAIGDEIARAVLALHPDLVEAFMDDVQTITEDIQFDARVGLMRTALPSEVGLSVSWSLSETIATNFNLVQELGRTNEATPFDVANCFDHLCALRVLGEDAQALNPINVFDATTAVLASAPGSPHATALADVRAAAFALMPELEAHVQARPVLATPVAVRSSQPEAFGR
jgi:hypothetical protein